MTECLKGERFCIGIHAPGRAGGLDLFNKVRFAKTIPEADTGNSKTLGKRVQDKERFPAHIHQALARVCKFDKRLVHKEQTFV